MYLKEATDTKVCIYCEEEKPRSEYHKDRARKDGLRPVCKDCAKAYNRRWYQENDEARARIQETEKERSKERYEEDPDYFWGKELKKRYGIDADDYHEMLEDQGGVCAICGTPPGETRLQVDHCHEEGTVRGLLCGPCNRGLGQFLDDLTRLRQAVAYLEGVATSTSRS